MPEKARSGKKERKPYRDYDLQVSQQIQTQQFAPVYLICGEQTYLRSYNLHRLQKAILGDGDAMNAALLTGPEVRAAQVIELAETLPFFAERRVITLTETEFLKKPGEEPEKLAEYLSRMPETTHLILEEPAPNATYKLYKAIAKVGLVVRCDLATGDRPLPQDMDQLRRWTAGLFSKDGLTISGDVLELFLQSSGTDMLNIKSEEAKLSSYCMGREAVTPQDIQAIGTPVVKDRIFDMIEAIAARERPKALAIYMDLVKLQTPPQVILALMTRQYNQLLQILELSSMGDRELAAELGLNLWALGNKLRPLVKGYTLERLEQSLEACMQADVDYKSGKITPELAVEKLIVLCSG